MEENSGANTDNQHQTQHPIRKHPRKLKINTNPRMHKSHNFEWQNVHNRQSDDVKYHFQMKLPKNYGEYLDHLAENGYEVPPNIWDIFYRGP